jgi:hypothetical protein
MAQRGAGAFGGVFGGGVGGVVGASPGGRRDGGVPPPPNLKEQKKLVREKMGEELRTRKYGRDTKQTRASCYLLTFNKLGIEI